MSLVRRILQASGGVKFAILVSADLVVLAVAALLTLVIRFDRLGTGLEEQFGVVLFGPPTAVAVFWLLGIYRVVVRYAGPSLGPRLALASGIVTIVLAGGSFLFDREGGQSRAVFLLFGILAFLGCWALRLAIRRISRHDPGLTRRPVVIYGAGTAGAGLAAALAEDRAWRPVAFIDDNPKLHRRKVVDLPVRSPRDLESLQREFELEAVFLALPSVDPASRRTILSRLRATGLPVLTIPTLEELIAGRAEFRDLRQLDIEDLIGRRTVSADQTLLTSAITGRSVLVTGGGGSIGSELCRQILRLGPARLVVVDSSEFNLYRIGQELRTTGSDQETRIELVLGDVSRSEFVEEVFVEHAPEVVLHAAAYKHVPIVESAEPEGVRTNTLGTRVVVEAAARHGADRFVLVSTDKAVRPTNVMGATKRVAELVVQATGTSTGLRTCIVRFGNVIGSSGSVVPLFREQIERGGPITVTDPEMTRFFMTIPDAAELVLQSAAMAAGGEVFLLDMGEPVRILELARSMITVSGLSVKDDANPDGDIAIEIVGARPGEKTHEELLIGEDSQASDHPRIRRANEASISPAVLAAAVTALEQAVERRDCEALRHHLEELGQLRSPSSAGRDARVASPGSGVS
ncbi:MAG: nucleoside-diphosphate sugar epimerase/dehydratase [Planctomycetota bacterium]|nr:nucleoside-diphosphate sugar epimerase/dehydratase [Planctomycetota bacterium]